MSRAGAAYIFLNSAFFCLIGIGVKFLNEIPALQIVLIRSLVSLAAGLVVLRRQNIFPLGKKENFPLLFVRGFIGTIGITLYFYTLKEIDFGEAVTLQYLSPIFTAIMALIFLRENTNWLAWLLYPVAFFGVFLMYQTGLDGSGVALAAGLGSAVCSGCAYTCIRALKTRENPNVIVFYFPLVNLPVAALWCFFNWVPPSPREWVGLLMVGVATHIAQFCMTRAFQLEKAGRVAIFGYLNVVLAFAVGFFVYGEQARPEQFTGVAIILVSLLLSSQSERLLARLQRRSA